ncbi:MULTISPECIES: hypothetical protein [Alkalimonas]|uniref:Uncharacterized protein n=1 Tax=Alkalimonas mucilaginosa TaxID=3057676 RepID=A0ABU7JK85_9GAMM|nr:hypothetical protein [Alkalimonas sp. MEB004]MEE2026113.1 hypothetical protein [Alkalimonas sp. MEB004]
MKLIWILCLVFGSASASTTAERTLIYAYYLPSTLSVQCEEPGKRLIAEVEVMNATHIEAKEHPQFISSLWLPAHKFAEDGRYVVNHFIVQNQDDSLALFTGQQKYLYSWNKAMDMLELAPAESVTIRVNLYDYFDIQPDKLKRIKFDLFGVRVQTPRTLIEQDIQSNWVYLPQGC